MSRELKFRAWDKDKGKMIDAEALSWLYLRLDGDKWSIRDYPNAEPLLLNYENGVLMQYTGRKDKNEKEIFEGDIVKYKNLLGCECEYDEWRESKLATIETAVIEFKNGEFYPREKFYECDDCFYDVRHFDFEIIGNIYENPNLLK